MFLEVLYEILTSDYIIQRKYNIRCTIGIRVIIIHFITIPQNLVWHYYYSFLVNQ